MRRDLCKPSLDDVQSIRAAVSMLSARAKFFRVVIVLIAYFSMSTIAFAIKKPPAGGFGNNY